VDDGSPDKTTDLVLQSVPQNSAIRLLHQPGNIEKGIAIQESCLQVQGRFILLVDGDGATKIEEFAALETKLLELQTKNS
jgi:dolichyl-phosphate beta-glucosyltransferase